MARIPLRIANDRALVWNVDDIAALRSNHHICGILTGTLPHLSQQNVFLGAPLILMPEEVVLLVENEVAELVDDPQAYPQPTIDQLNRWNELEQQSINQQLALNESRSQNSEKVMSAEAVKKRQEREEKKRRAKAGVTPDQDDPIAFLASPSGVPNSSLEGPTSHMTPNPSPGTPTKPSSTAYNIIVPAESESLDWYSPTSVTYPTIAAARDAGVWTYPSNVEERARCGVFRGLWEQGYFLGGGIKFGGEYLVYPGDPLRFHSHFVASVIASPTSTLRPMEIVAHGRLGTATKKAHLLCGWDDEKGEVSYLSIEWAGFG